MNLGTSSYVSCQNLSEFFDGEGLLLTVPARGVSEVDVAPLAKRGDHKKRNEPRCRLTSRVSRLARLAVQALRRGSLRQQEGYGGHPPQGQADRGQPREAGAHGHGRDASEQLELGTWTEANEKDWRKLKTWIDIVDACNRTQQRKEELTCFVGGSEVWAPYFGEDETEEEAELTREAVREFNDACSQLHARKRWRDRPGQKWDGTRE